MVHSKVLEAIFLGLKLFNRLAFPCVEKALLYFALTRKKSSSDFRASQMLTFIEVIPALTFVKLILSNFASSMVVEEHKLPS